MPRLVDFYCCAGGAAVGYARAGFEVVGVDVAPMPDYPFEFVKADALKLLSDRTFMAQFDAVHASPPCKAFTVARKVHEATRPSLFDKHEDLLTPTLARLAEVDVPWVVENVPGAPMPADSITLCGSSFGLEVRRHRLFASNVPIVGLPCRHDLQPHPVGVYGTGGAWTRTAPGGGGRKVSGADAARALGITHTNRQAVLSQAIPPAYTEHLGRQLLAHINGQVAA